uniref:Transposase n=1 Tax=Steinernema glaseri TaxID=37863 RepID=A0A1I7YQ05_9BILA
MESSSSSTKQKQNGRRSRLVHRVIQELTQVWGRLGEVFWTNRNIVRLFYVSDGSDRWSFYYRLDGWKHTKERTLCPEVLRRSSKRITAFDFRFATYLTHRRAIEGWIPINPHDEQLQLLMSIGAPDKRLNSPSSTTSEWQLQMVRRCSPVLRHFTSFKTTVEFHRDVIQWMLEEIAATRALHVAKLPASSLSLQ